MTGEGITSGVSSNSGVGRWVSGSMGATGKTGAGAGNWPRSSFGMYLVWQKMVGISRDTKPPELIPEVVSIILTL